MRKWSRPRGVKAASASGRHAAHSSAAKPAHRAIAPPPPDEWSTSRPSAPLSMAWLVRLLSTIKIDESESVAKATSVARAEIQTTIARMATTTETPHPRRGRQQSRAGYAARREHLEPARVRHADAICMNAAGDITRFSIARPRQSILASRSSSPIGAGANISAKAAVPKMRTARPVPATRKWRGLRSSAATSYGEE